MMQRFSFSAWGAPTAPIVSPAFLPAFFHPFFRIFTLLAFVTWFLIGGSVATAQVGIGTTEPNPNAVLDISAQTSPGGLLIPRVELAGANQVYPPNGQHVMGMIVFNTEPRGSGSNEVFVGFYYNNGSGWVRFAEDTGPQVEGWSILGNAGTESTTNFLGTTDDQPLRFRTNNLNRLTITSGDHNTGGKLLSNNYADAATPSYSWIGRTNTGMFSPDPNQIGFSTNGTERLRINPQGRVGIGTTNPNQHAILDLNGTLGGFLLPRIALTATNSPNPLGANVAGMTVYNTATAGTGANAVSPGFYYNDGSRWVRIAGSGDIKAAWELDGNEITTSNFLGSTNDMPLRFRTKNNNRFTITAGEESAAGRLHSHSYGTETLPTYSWIGRTNTGIYSPGGNQIGFSTNATERFRIPNSNQVHGMNGGTAALPFYSWNGRANTGMFSPAANTLAFSTNANEAMRIDANRRVMINRTTAVTNTRLSVSETGANRSILGSSASGEGIRGEVTTGDGVMGIATTGIGVRGASTENGVGGYFRGQHNNAFGAQISGGNGSVYVFNNSGTGAAVTGRLYGTTSIASTVSNGIGVLGVGNNISTNLLLPTVGSGVAGYGEKVGVFGGSRQNGDGIWGFSSGTGDGVYGQTNGTGNAIAGVNLNSQGMALIGAGNGVNGVLAGPIGGGGSVAGYQYGFIGVGRKDTWLDGGGIGLVGMGNNNVSINHLTDGVGVTGNGFVGVHGFTLDPFWGFGMYSHGDIGVEGSVYADNLFAPRGIITDVFSVDDTGMNVDGNIYGETITASGNLSAAGTKNFEIDHPLDPANKYLKHASVESNEVLNLYRGTAVFDSNGMAYVQLPEYYGEINRHETYQLTPIGAAMPNLYIAEKVNNNRFVIGGGVAGKEVSWTVTAERNDAYVRSNPSLREMEVDKKENRGLYVSPEAYGKPIERQIAKNKMEQVREINKEKLEKGKEKKEVSIQKLEEYEPKRTELEEVNFEKSNNEINKTIDSSALNESSPSPNENAPQTQEVNQNQSTIQNNLKRERADNPSELNKNSDRK